MHPSHSPQQNISPSPFEKEGFFVVQNSPLIIGKIISNTKFQAERFAEKEHDWRFTLRISRDAKSFEVDGIGEFSGRYNAKRFLELEKYNPLLALCIMETYGLVCETMMH